VAARRLGALGRRVKRLARTAAADGVYTTTAARLVLILGWWLLAGGLAASAAERHGLDCGDPRPFPAVEVEETLSHRTSSDRLGCA
jgi:hypothetical protein